MDRVGRSRQSRLTLSGMASTKWAASVVPGSRQQARAIFRKLAATYPDAHCELDFTNPLELLIATVLSAQCTDQRVNKVTPELFARYPSAADLDALVTLPGVGRKTAKVVLGNSFDIPGITVDTHFARLTRGFGWTNEKNPDKAEKDVAALFPEKDYTMLSHDVVWHGGRVCHARRPACGACSVSTLCPSFEEGPTDPSEAAQLVRTQGRA